MMVHFFRGEARERVRIMDVLIMMRFGHMTSISSFILYHLYSVLLLSSVLLLVNFVLQHPHSNGALRVDTC
jgi:hypothetical protein